MVAWDICSGHNVEVEALHLWSTGTSIPHKNAGVVYPGIFIITN